jgi:hypothetical protein
MTEKIDDIGRQAVTIHCFIDEVQGSAFDRYRTLTLKQVKIVKKVVNKFLRNMKKSEYYYLSSEAWGDSFYQNIVNHVDRHRKEDEKEPDYLTWIQYQFHSFIKEVFPSYYDGLFRVKKGRFYKKTLEMLLR